MKFIRKWYWLLYPSIGGVIGLLAGLQLHEDATMMAGEGAFLGLICAVWYWIRKQRRGQWY
jgi:hypothetical protein